MDIPLTKKWTINLRKALSRTIARATSAQLPSALPGHLLLAIAETNGSLGASILERTKLDIVMLEDFLQARGHFESTASLSPRVQHILFSATTLAYHAEHTHVGTEHVLLALLNNDSPEIKTFAEISNWKIDDARDQLKTIIKSESKLNELTQSFFEDVHASHIEDDDIPHSLRDLGIHLTHPEYVKKLDPVIGREQELERVIQILSRRTKNNPVLLGEPGVGKTAIVEALAIRLAAGNVPHELLGKKIVSLEVGSLIAGTMYRGEFEQRIKNMLDDIADNDNIILFIDELHTIVGAGSSSGSVDAANLLKPALARGRLRCIGATTLNEYRQHIENDGALERRFQPVPVNEPSAAATRFMLGGLKPRYEAFHKVKLTDEVLDTAVKLADRYLPDRFMPDKAIDLIDEAAARIKIKSETPNEVRQIFNLKEQLRNTIKQKEQATTKEDFKNAWVWKEKERALFSEIKILEDNIAQTVNNYPQVTGHTLAEVVTAWTGVPVNEHRADELLRLELLEDKLNQKIIGQTEAVATIAAAIRRGHYGIADHNRPRASFLFAGPSGVGKTSLAKALAEQLFGDAKAILHFDMSEYAEGYTVSKLIGAPSGYVGYKESGILTEQVRRKPYQVILFDELDKAHRDVHNLLLQILDAGALRDSAGRLINFKQTIVIATANPHRHSDLPLGFSQDATPLLDSQEAIKQLFPTELRDRFDSVVTFRNLTAQHLSAIADQEIKYLNERLLHQSLQIKISESGRQKIATDTKQQGVRHLQRIIKEQVEQLLLTELAKPNRRKKTFTLSAKKNNWHLT